MKSTKFKNKKGKNSLNEFKKACSKFGLNLE